LGPRRRTQDDDAHRIVTGAEGAEKTAAADTLPAGQARAQQASPPPWIVELAAAIDGGLKTAASKTTKSSSDCATISGRFAGEEWIYLKKS
jgi:hypothetical protein